MVVHLGISLSFIQRCQLRVPLPLAPGSGVGLGEAMPGEGDGFSDLTGLSPDLQQVLHFHMLTDPCS